jgi:hypothetical protein
MHRSSVGARFQPVWSESEEGRERQRARQGVAALANFGGEGRKSERILGGDGVLGLRHN